MYSSSDDTSDIDTHIHWEEEPSNGNKQLGHGQSSAEEYQCHYWCNILKGPHAEEFRKKEAAKATLYRAQVKKTCKIPEIRAECKLRSVNVFMS